MYVLVPGWGYDTELEKEIPAIEKYCRYDCVLSYEPGQIVLPRFRAIPFGRELEREVELQGSSLINSYREHLFAADLGHWYAFLQDYTPQSWVVNSIPLDEDGPFVVKGETNSKRQQWKTHCFAEDRSQLGTVIANLLQDSLIQHQRIWVRKYIPLRNLGTDVVGMPISEEYRVFYLNGKPIAKGFYWVNHLEDLDFTPVPEEIPDLFLERVGERIRPHITFAAVDFARTEKGYWIVIEVNDGCMSGMTGCDPFEVYKALSEYD